MEGFSTPKHLVKEDGSVAKLDEKLDFKVIDFNKNNRRIIVSQSRIHEDIRRENDSQDQEQKRSANEQTKNAVRRLNASQEKTTLGDISELAALRENMEKSAQEGNASQAAQNEDK